MIGAHHVADKLERASARESGIADGYRPPGPSFATLDKCGRSRWRRTTAASAVWTNSALRMVRLGSPLKAERSIEDFVSNTIQKASARLKTAAAVGALNGNDNFRLVPSRDSSTAIASPALPGAGARSSAELAGWTTGAGKSAAALRSAASGGAETGFASCAVGFASGTEGAAAELAGLTTGVGGPSAALGSAAGAGGDEGFGSCAVCCASGAAGPAGAAAAAAGTGFASCAAGFAIS